MLGLFFFCAFSVVGFRMGMLATSEAQEPLASAPGAAIAMQRANIVDREGSDSCNQSGHLFGLRPTAPDDRSDCGGGSVGRDLPRSGQRASGQGFHRQRKFLWIKKRISPEQKQAVHDIGDPGILFGPREMRLYPNGKLAAHILGGSGFGREGVSAAEVIGVAGVEKKFDDYLRDPANGNKPLQLSLDLTIQAAVEQVLYGGMKIMNAKGASAVLMNAHTGEVVSAASLPCVRHPGLQNHSGVGVSPDDGLRVFRRCLGVVQTALKVVSKQNALSAGLFVAALLVFR